MDLSGIQDYCRDRLDRKSAGRDAALAGSRTTIRFCANSIRAVHRSEWKEAKRLMREAEKTLREAEKALNDVPPQDSVENYIKEALRRIGSRR
jgi:translin